MILFLLSILDFNIQHALNDFYNASVALNTSILIFQNLTLSSSLSPLVGLRAGEWAYYNNTLIFADGERYGILKSKEPVNGVYIDCIEDEYDPSYAWACDFDNDFCAENVVSVEVNQSARLMFLFRNESFNVTSSSDVVPFPSALISLLADSNGNESLLVVGEVRKGFFYTVNDKEWGVDSCVDSLEYHYKEIVHPLNFSILVSGAHKTAFLNKPVLGEQWFRNNRFNTALFSQAPFYLIEYKRNGESIRKEFVRNVTVAQDRFGFLYLNVSPLISSREMRGNAYLVPLSSSSSNYSFIYVFDERFEGLGYSNHTIKAVDVFNDSRAFFFKTLSRKLSYAGNFSELGERKDSLTRKSASYSPVLFSLLAGSLGVLFIFFFFKKPPRY